MTSEHIEQKARDVGMLTDKSVIDITIAIPGQKPATCRIFVSNEYLADPDKRSDLIKLALRDAADALTAPEFAAIWKAA